MFNNFALYWFHIFIIFNSIFALNGAHAYLVEVSNFIDGFDNSAIDNRKLCHLSHKKQLEP
jgi:hypothetical protein